MARYTKEYFYGLSMDEQISLWNEFCYENSWLNVIYDNDLYGFEELFDSSAQGLQDMARAIFYGEFNYMDTYCTLDGAGNLKTFTYESDFHDIIDIDELLNWLEEEK